MVHVLSQGSFVAMVTPFDGRGGIDFPAVARLLAYHRAAGTAGVVVGGTNGEGASLSGPEKRDLVSFAVEQGEGLAVVAGLATCSISEAVWLAKRALEAGAAATLAMPPFYFRTASEAGIEAWFRTLLDAVEMPCILYNFPQATGIRLSEALVGRLFAYAHVLGIKDSSGDEASLDGYLREAASAGKTVFVGDERLASRCVQAGGSVISGLANSYPKLVARVVAEPGEPIQGLVDRAFAAIKRHPQPAVHKHVLDLRGVPGGPLRPPLESLGDEAAAEVAAFVRDFGWE